MDFGAIQIWVKTTSVSKGQNMEDCWQRSQVNFGISFL